MAASPQWGGIFAIAASHIPNNAVWKPVVRLQKGHDLALPVWRSPHVPAKPKTPVQRRSATPEFMEMIDRPRPVAGAEFIGGGQRAAEIGFCGADGFAKLMAPREIGRDRRR